MRIFVFGSNLAGRHGAGSAKAAVERYGAIYGVGVGHQGNSYAIPTKDENLKTLPLGDVARYIYEFVKFANEQSAFRFDVVKIGCGLAGFQEYEIAPLFSYSPMNVNLPDGWLKFSDYVS